MKIGTRGSDLALVQARLIEGRLVKEYPGLSVEIVPIKTRGDRMQDVALVEIGGKGVFVKEIEQALLRGEIDAAVHSMKDVPVELPDELEIAAVPEREDPRDVLITKGNRKLEELPEGARIGTGSLRRRMQLLSLMPDIEVVSIRGNLNTRIRKITTEDLDGIIVAAAGMRRMGWLKDVSQFLSAEAITPAAGQGVLGLEIRKDDDSTRGILSFLNHEKTVVEISAERAFLRCLGGGCQVPIAGFAQVQGDWLVIRGMVGSPDGKVIIADTVRGEADRWEELGTLLAEGILSRGGRSVLDMVYHSC